MVYYTQRPSEPLGSFITHFTYYKDHTPEHSIDRFLPNGNVEIVIDLTDTPKYIFDNVTLTQVQACNRIWISGIRRQFITIPSGRDSEMFVINFARGKVAPFVNLPLGAITDQVIDGDLILQPIFLHLRDRLLDCATAAEKFKVADQLLTRRFAGALYVNPVIEYAVNKISAAPEMTSINRVTLETGYSAKHLIHLFEQGVGVSPKAFLRILRFQKSLREIDLKGKASFTGLALDCGYYDQSHFIADFKSFSGFTPVEYQKRRSAFPDYVPVV